MSLTLGEKLRQAREERGFTLSEIAEQTRISSSYLESIEKDDYRILPGGIFNKGFVKSYAKFVGINEQEALADYAEIISQTSAGDEEEFKPYRPEVLTDDRSSGSMIPTIILAVVILGLMSAGILFLVDYLQRQSDQPIANTSSNTNVNGAVDDRLNTNTGTASSTAPDMATLKIEFKTLSQPVSLTATSDGKTTNKVVNAGSAEIFEPRESLKLSYSKSLANAVQLTINGKTIALPAQPLFPKRNAIEFEINKSNLSQIWTTGAISSDVPAAMPDANANIATPPANAAVTTTPVAAPIKPTPNPKPVVASNTAAKPTPDKTPAEPITTRPKPAATRP